MYPINSFWPVSLFLAGLLLSAAGLWLMLPWLRRGFLDDPNKPNSAHANPIPSAGGIVFVLLAILFGLLSLAFQARLGLGSSGWLAWIPLICLPLAAVGMLDDQRGVSVWVRFGVQSLTAGFLLAISPLPFTWLMVIPLMVLLVAVINFINFIDGMDGLLGGTSAVLMLAAALTFSLVPSPDARGFIGLPMYPLVGAIVGFLVWNWSPAKVFMGDVGSTFIGSVFVGYVLQQRDVSTAISLFLVSFPLIADAGGCVLRRIQAKQPILKPHKLMLYQRLNQSGWKHSQVALLYMILVSSLAIAHILSGLKGVLIIVIIQALICLWLDQRVAVPFLVSLRRSQRATG
ncbi:MAG: glycosyl transferase [Cyanobacteriota bacterium]|nr:glycosyl transferase [Cyanobacteriota bacterium]